MRWLLGLAVLLAGVPGAALTAELLVPPMRMAGGKTLATITADGQISLLDAQTQHMRARLHLDARITHATTAADGRVLAIAGTDRLVFLDEKLTVLRELPIRDARGQRVSAVSRVRDAPVRRSFVVALRDLPEVWEISYDPQAEDIPAGTIHDFQFKEGAFVPGYLNPRRTLLGEPLLDFVLTHDQSELLGRGGDRQLARAINLDVRKQVATLVLPAPLSFESARSFVVDGHTYMELLRQDNNQVLIIATYPWAIREAWPGFPPQGGAGGGYKYGK